MSTTITVRDLPDEIHHWLKAQAASHHRSVNKEVIAVLDSARGTTARRQRISIDGVLEIARKCSTTPDLDARTADEIIGYDDSGIPA
jgi:plasmid stability protein